MTPNGEQLAGLNVALNEARLLSLDLDLVRRVASIELSVLTLPELGPPLNDPRIQLWLFPVGRVGASMVNSDGEVRPLAIGQLSDIVRSFGGAPIYGWEFFDPPETNLASWSDRLSLNVRLDQTSMNHRLHLFQEDGQRTLDVCVWFDGLELRDPRDPTRGTLSLDRFIAGGKRWWDGLFSGDPRTTVTGIQPLKK